MNGEQAKSKNCLFNLTGSALLLAIPVFLLSRVGVNYISPASGAQTACRIFQSLAGAAILLFLPSFFLVPILLRKPPRSFFSFLSAALGLNLVFYLLVTAAIVALGRKADPASVLAAAVPVAVVGALLGRRRPELPPASGFDVFLPAGAALLFIAGMLLTILVFKPIGSKGALPWPARDRIILEETARLLETGRNEAVKVLRDENWLEESPQVFRPRAGRADIRLVNSSSEPVPYPLVFLFDAAEESQIELRLNGWYLFHHYFPPPFDPVRHTRHHLVSREIFSHEITLDPGENLLEAHFRNRRGRYFTDAFPILVRDYSASTRCEFAACFRSSYFLADTAALHELRTAEETILDRFLPRGLSSDGVFFEGSAPSLGRRFFPHLLTALGGALSGSDPLLRAALAWAVLVILWACLIETGREDLSLAPWVAVFPATAITGLFLWAVGGRVESMLQPAFLALAAIRTWSHLSRRETGLFLTWGLVCLLTPGGAVAFGAGLAGYAFTFRELRYPLKKTLPLLVPIAILLGAYLLAFRPMAEARGWGDVWKRIFGPAGVVLSGMAGGWRQIGETAKLTALFFWLAMAGSGFLFAGWFLPSDRLNRFFLSSALLAGFFSGGIWAAAAVAGDPPPTLNTLLPFFFLFALPALGAISSRPAPARKTLAVVFALLPLLAIPHLPWLREAAWRIDFPPQTETRQQAAAMDYLVRRHREEQGRENIALIQRMFYRFIRGQGRGIGKIYERMGLELNKEMMVEEAAALFGQAQFLQETGSKTVEKDIIGFGRHHPGGRLSPSPVSPGSP